MSLKRIHLNLILLTICILMGLWAAFLIRRPQPDMLSDKKTTDSGTAMAAGGENTQIATEKQQRTETDAASASVAVTSEKELPSREVKVTDFREADLHKMTASHPFRLEAAKVLSGKLEETDSVSRRKILSYCEHLRTSYTTRDIDFIRQVFSDNALIIVGHVVKTGEKSGVSGNSKVVYSVRSKREYLEKLSRIFDSGKAIDVKFSEFRILRHPTMKGIYGVTLRQKYSCGGYSDEGYLFLLWDFRSMSMPLIHVRTWQPTLNANPDEDDIIGIGDFNLE